ncbi:hypothetical protein F5I97DRAFT_2065805 [Phlebopus sp. FC_14]|nr:hypothetical protein F5I97DRAFT_2065805 [Phlebopus sp. FC_14]
MSPPDPPFVRVAVPAVNDVGYASDNATLFDFASPPVFADPLLPPEHEWPVFDTASMYTLSTLSSSPAGSPSSSVETSPSPNFQGDTLPDSEARYPSAFPSSAALASMHIPPSRGLSRNKSPNHVPRPRNAFMLFRSAFSAAQKISTNIEHDNRHITRIIAHCWNRLSEAEKQVWRDKAAAEKAQHAQRYPNYRFSPVCRDKTPVRRNVRRNGIEDRKRCEKVAELLLAGKHGDELESAVKQMDISLNVESSARNISIPLPDIEGSQTAVLQGWHPRQGDSEDCDIRPFRSPLLPPAKAASAPPQILTSGVNFPSSSFDTAPMVHDYQHLDPHDVHTNISLAALRTSFLGYERDETPSTDCLPSMQPASLSHAHPVMDYIESGYHNQDPFPPDFSTLTWIDIGQSDSFSSSGSSSSSSYLY